MGKANCCCYFVNILTTSTAAAEEVHFNIIGTYADIYFFCFSQDCYCSSRGVNATRSFSFRNSLYPVNTAFKFKVAEDAFALHFKDNFFESTKFCGIIINNLNLPSLFLGISTIHPEKIGSKKSCFTTSSASSNLD